MQKKDEMLSNQNKKISHDKIFSMENPKDFALEVMLNNDFKSVQDLTAYLKKLPYCVAPWLHSHLNPAGERKLCCVAQPSGIDYATPFDEYWNSKYLQDVRAKMIAQTPPLECAKCINHKGAGSQRSLYLHLLLYLRQLSKIEWEPVTKLKPVSIDYRINRSCNFTCRMCTSTASSAIEKLEQDAFVTPVKNNITKEVGKNLKEEIFEIINSGQVLDINFADGEPFISTLHWEILEYLVASGLSEKVILRYSSNISTLNYKGIYIPQYLKDNFFKVFVSISIDGIEKTAEFVRDGLRWENWYRNYKSLHECFGDKSIHFNITVSLPVLLDIVNLSNFLDKEKIDFSIGSSHPEGNELLISPLSLDSETLKEVVAKRLVSVENEKVKTYLEQLLATHSDKHLLLLKENFDAIRTYYIKIDFAKKRESLIDYLENQVELAIWWQQVCPEEFRTIKTKNYNKLLSILNFVPNELGRYFYKAYFFLIKLMVKLLYGNKVELWYRNSLNQKFFKFGKSDIDLSVEFKTNEDLKKSYKELKEILLKLPLVKEINIYYPYSLDVVSHLMNCFELKRDKVLFHKMNNCYKKENGDAQSLTFLLRMLFSNQQVFKNGIRGRDLEKWHSYLKLSGFEIVEKITEGMSCLELLEEILKKYSLELKTYHQSIYLVFFYVVNKIPIHVLFNDLIYKNEMICMFPQLFCSLEVHLDNVTSFNEEIFIEQLSWEIMSTMTQTASVSHLEKLSRLLKNAKLTSVNSIASKEKLLKSLESFKGIINE